MNDKTPADDGIDRRGFLQCMAWVGTGLVWSFSGGIPTSRVFGAEPTRDASTDFTFAQISDSHIGFAKEPNKDVVGTLRTAIQRINALPKRPHFLLHTGDITHLSKPEEFDTCSELIREAKVERALYVPGEHDVFSDDGKQYLQRYGAGTQGLGWHSFDYKGVHFVGLVNVANLKPGGLGVLGEDQLEWLRKDLEGLTDSTPIVAYAHVPLWAVYPKWGWGTEDSERALALMRRFGSATILNGHIHQVMQKVEGHVTFHTAASTAFPQPEPGKADSPGPIKNIPAEKLRSMLGLTSVRYIERPGSLAIVDSALE
jgi:hypothetical protein